MKTDITKLEAIHTLSGLFEASTALRWRRIGSPLKEAGYVTLHNFGWAVLQQAWINREKGDVQWRDIPVEDDSKTQQPT